MGGKRRSGRSMLAVRHDDDDNWYRCFNTFNFLFLSIYCHLRFFFKKLFIYSFLLSHFFRMKKKKEMSSFCEIYFEKIVITIKIKQSKKKTNKKHFFQVNTYI